MKAKLIYTDKYGNKLFKKYIKTRKIWQLSAKNAEGKLVDIEGLKKLSKKSGFGTIKKKKR